MVVKAEDAVQGNCTSAVSPVLSHAEPITSLMVSLSVGDFGGLSSSCYSFLRSAGRVAEWQTRWLQVPVSL